MSERTAIDSLRVGLDRLLDTHGADGYAGITLVGYDDQIVCERGVGFADVERGIAFSSDTVVSIGSITKQFTGAAIMKAEALALLSTGDRIGEFFDDVPSDKHAITLHHLLTHTSGLESNFADDFDATATREWYIKAALDSVLRSPVGSRCHYSNAGYSLATAVLEIASGRTYEDFLQEHLFGPAEMQKTGYVVPRWEPDELAHGYVGGADHGSIVTTLLESGGPYWNLRGNGGIHSTAREMFGWHLALESDTLLPRTYRERLQAPFVSEAHSDGRPMDSQYGYGWTISLTPRGTYLTSHNGSDGIRWAEFLRFRQEGVVVFLASNISEKPCIALRESIEHLLFG